MQVEYIRRESCPLRQDDVTGCRTHWQHVVNVADHETGLGKFDVVRCTRCQLGMTDPYPTPETTGLLYDSKNSSDFDIISGSWIDRVKDYLSSRLLRRLAGDRKVSTILDYATGNGRFALNAAKQYPGAQVHAVDYQPTPPALLEQNQVRYFEAGPFEQTAQLYDLIVLRHVLEHTHDPVGLITMLGERLTPSGRLYIEVPNLDSGCGRIFATHWKLYYVPRHIYHYTRQSLAEIIERAGLQATIAGNEMPMMGNTFAIMTGMDQGNIVAKGIGVILHPLQLLIERLHGSSTCLNAVCRRP